MKPWVQTLRTEQNVQEGCLKGLIWVDMIIAKEMNSKFRKAIKVIKKWDKILDVFPLDEENKRWWKQFE